MTADLAAAWQLAVIPAAVFVTWAAKALGRWLNRAFSRSMEDAITLIMQPRFDAIGSTLGDLRRENARDHLEVSDRLEALEARVAQIETHLNPQETST